ncbi:phosphotransferase [Vibrio sp. SS-MA-C1-2]|uniref:phosphotransferase n=1 Tax=Vibrio sp. SS-MA-C1-2 TaxID=2908646 RepID=UPI001F2817C8|nr:phosphotransferase [Vibrio sp. SS-MA-C1-2]UJF19834.1 phosphotransferase [Vibrio sp. SS-MA-C1-2]
MKIEWHQACQLEPSLQTLNSYFSAPHLLSPSDQHATYYHPKYAEPLSGGLTNRCWRIDLQKSDEENTNQHVISFVWRPHSAILTAFDISRTQEFEILKQLSEHSTFRAPRPQLLNNQGLLVEWIMAETASINPHSLTLTSIVNTIPSVDEQLQLLARLHQVKLNPQNQDQLRQFSFTDRVDHYWHQLTEKYQQTRFSDLYHAYRQLPFEIESTALCHFDLGDHNLIAHHNRWVAIDWEYAAIADPKLDLAITLSLLDIPLEEGVERYCHFAKIDDSQSWIKKVNAYRPHLNMMVMLWYLIHAEFYPQQEGIKMANYFADKYS